MAQAQEEKTTPPGEAGAAAENGLLPADLLSGPQKAAALLVALGKPAAMNLIKYLDANDLRQLNGHAKTLPDITIQELDQLVRQFEDAFAQGASFSRAGERFTSLVQETLSEDEAAAVLNPSPAAISQESVLDIMGRMPAEDLQLHLANEHPQVVAYIMSRLPDSLTAKLLLLQSADIRAEIIQRTLYSKAVQPVIEDILNQSLHTVLARETANEQQSHYKQIAMILNQLDKSELDEVMASLERLKAEDLSNIKARMFVFEDIARLTDRARLLLFDGIAADVVIRALRGADNALAALVLASLSQRTRRMVEAELATPDEQTTQSDILLARRTIAAAALKLAEQGAISLGAEGEAAS